MLRLPFPENELRFDPTDPRGHVESFFLKANSPGGNRAIWIKHTVLSPRDRPEDAVAEVWAVAFVRGDKSFPIAVKATVPFGEARFRGVPFRAEHPNAVLEPTRARGDVVAFGHRIGWSIELEPKGPCHAPFPYPRMYTGTIPRTKVLSPVPDTMFFGSVEVDAHRWVLDGWRGMQGHNWGPEHTSHYAWIHANAWESEEEAWFEGMAGRVPVAGRLSPWLATMALHVEGETLRFDDPRTIVGADLAVGLDRFRFHVARGGTELTGVFAAQRAEMAGLGYENPDGSVVTCLNSKLAAGRLLLRRPGRPDRELRTRRAALEIGTKDPGHGVRILA